MSFRTNVYYKTLAENEKNIRFWEDYLQNLKSLDFNIYADKLAVPILVPIGSRIFFRGDLKHTNEVTVSLGADYFTKCSIKQAEILRQHRIKDAESKLGSYKKEREYLENQLMFSKQNVYEDKGQEIIEVYSEEEEKVWREKHREKVRQYKQNQLKDEQSSSNEIIDQELWDRLEELELQEELENELQHNKDNEETSETKYSFVVKDDLHMNKKDEQHTVSKREDKQVACIKTKTPLQTPKLDLLQQVLDKQHELEQKIIEMKNREWCKSKNENDLISKLDEMEQLEELEDEMNRLDDILQSEDVEEQEGNANKLLDDTIIKKSVLFADEDDSETLEIMFKHYEVEPCKEPYNPGKGMQKPSDVYEAYSNLFDNTKSILKKSKCETFEIPIPREKKISVCITNVENTPEIDRTIVVTDVVEKVNENINHIEASDSRPTSIFRKRRQQKSLGNVIL